MSSRPDSPVQILAPAKINLNLAVGPRRADGYHRVCSLMEPVSLFDRLVMKRRRAGGLALDGGGVPAAENTVTKAVLALEKLTGFRLDAKIELEKGIPVAAGLGGGSSDAATALKLIESTFGLKVSEAEMAALAFSVGADVPFFLKNGARLAEGAGEDLADVGCLPNHWIVLASPGFELSAERVYQKFDEMGGGDEMEFAGRSRRLHEDIAALGGFESLSRVIRNDLEPAAVSICSGVAELKQRMEEAGCAAVLMSGSGPSVFGLFPDSESARAAARRLRPRVPSVWVVRPLL